MVLFCFFQNDSIESLFVRDSTDHTSTTSQNYKIGLAGVRVLDFFNMHKQYKSIAMP